jgi:hypothetical protein
VAGDGQLLFEPEIFLLQHRIGQTHPFGLGLGRVVTVAQCLPLPVEEGNIRNAQFLSQVFGRLFAGHQQPPGHRSKLRCIGLSSHAIYFPIALTVCPPNRGNRSTYAKLRGLRTAILKSFVF